VLSNRQRNNDSYSGNGKEFRIENRTKILLAGQFGGTPALQVVIKLADCHEKIRFDIAARLRQRLLKLTARFPLPC
jgi:hypothetical protein